MSVGGKIHLGKNVYQAAMRRIEWVFSEFENIYVSFSGGKDSGLLLNLCMQFMRERGIRRKIGVFHQDFEAQYSATTDYVTHMLTDPANLELITPYWCCLPMSCKTATSMHEQYWTPWHPDQESIWVRPMPEVPGVINLANAPSFYRRDMLQEDLYAEFLPWYHAEISGRQGKTICLVGIRAQESLNRWRAITADKGTYKGMPWITDAGDNAYSAYPIYDWTTEDIWTANARFGFDYNKLYDLFHYAGLSVAEMRVASPFNDWALGSLKLYRVLEPEIWGKMVGRVNGANFTAIYGGTHAMGWKNIQLPAGHTWKSYLAFLLQTLPDETRRTYEEKFATSFKFWAERGGVLSAETIEELRQIGIAFTIKGKTNYATDKVAVTFPEYPDDADVKDFQTVPSYKRMAICILKNDHLCKFMGFSQTKIEKEKRETAIAKYMAF